MFSQTFAFVATEFNMKAELFKMFLSLGVIVGLAFFVGWWLKRAGKARLTRFNSSSKIKILERRPLSQKSSLYLIEVEGKKMLVGDSPAGVHPIVHLEGPIGPMGKFTLEKSEASS